MSDTLITVEHVSKKFCSNLKQSLWYGVKDLGTELLGKSHNTEKLRKNEFWAVRDVSLSVDRGETVGMIGHNGAGKTTILRMLNGLIKPDQGRIKIQGRMQALIALGAGFNPVLTGRENIQINASILGFSNKHIDRLFDQIVDFSGLEEFIDMPVQSYSSGMVVRLGFSVAAHLEPDILLVDEVLAVGDLAFKTKCQVRIQELRNSGVAIILVSHNLHTISHICNRAITFEKGRVIFEGDTEKAIDAYRTSLIKRSENKEVILRAGTGEIRIREIEILNIQEKSQKEFDIDSPVKIRIHYQVENPVINPVFNITLHILNSYQVTGFRTDVDGYHVGKIDKDGYIDIIVPQLNLLPNVYSLDAVIFHQDGYTFYDRVNNVGYLEVKGGLLINGSTYIPHSWQMHGS